MTEPKWAPAPWRADGTRVLDAAGDYLGKVAWQPRGPRGLDEAWAIGSLWAAAPDLYEALALARSVRTLDELPMEQFRKIDAALAKARGETP